MNVKIYASGVLAYDSQLPEEKGYSMLSIRIKECLNKGGSATLVLPSGHKLYDGFPAMVTPVEIYRDGKLRWRGRPLPHSGDFHNRRTITCEGELCFLNDATMRPYSLSGSPAELFTKLIDVYNAAVDEWKRFAVGEITVTSDSPVELSYSGPEQIYATVQKLRSKCGGYILFDSAEDGSRRINWYSQLPYRCNQGIQLGSNLLDYSSSASVSGFATRIIPYGAEDSSGTRLQIDVDGKDYVDNLEVQAVRGIIEKSMIYEGVTDPAELKILAEKDLQSAANIPETMQLSALDLSRFDLSLDSFFMGQIVSAASDVHNLTGQYALVSLDEDLAQSGVGSVTLTRDALYYDSTEATLTGSITSAQQKQEAARLSSMAAAVANATNWITNGSGYMVAIRDATGNWTELCSLDNPDIDTAVNVWRWNNGGLGHSSNGYKGPYTLALTQDGHIVADFITTGTLDAALVKIKNLITDHLLSKSEYSSLEITGARLSMRNAQGETFELANSDDQAYIYFCSYNSAGEETGRGQLGANRLYLGGTWADPTFSVESFHRADGTPGSTMRIGSINPGKALLWSGTCAQAGSITVPNTADYDLFAIRLGNDAETFSQTILAYKAGGKVMGVGGWAGTASDAKSLHFVTFSHSGNAWTLEDCGLHFVYLAGSISEGTRLNAKEIWGIV